MTDDRAELFSSLRISTVALLGYDVDNLTAAQKIRVDRAIALRLVIDDAQARQMRGEQIDVRAFVDASEDLERMVGGRPDAPNEATRFGPSARERLRRLIETTVLAAAVEDPAEVERKAERMRREEMAAVIAAAGGTIESAPSGPATVAPPPPPERPANVVPLHYLKENQHEPWRDFYDGRVTGPSPWPLPR